VDGAQQIEMITTWRGGLDVSVHHGRSRGTPSECAGGDYLDPRGDIDFFMTEYLAHTVIEEFPPRYPESSRGRESRSIAIYSG